VYHAVSDEGVVVVEHRCGRCTDAIDVDAVRGPAEPSSYTCIMDVATTRAEVGIRELKNGLSRYIERVRAGDEVIVTDRGRPVARLSPLDASEDRLADLVASGLVRPPASRDRHVPASRIKVNGPVSDLVAEQRR
jgi:prevent-host-death family protein